MRLLNHPHYIFVTLSLGVFLPAVATSQIGPGGGGGPTPLMCFVSTSNTPVIRSEGLTEALSDIFIFCLGGTSAAVGQPVPQVNVTVYLPAPVTSRLLKGNVSEALLLLDEPNSGLPLPGVVPGFGPAERSRCARRR